MTPRLREYAARVALTLLSLSSSPWQGVPGRGVPEQGVPGRVCLVGAWLAGACQITCALPECAKWGMLGPDMSDRAYLDAGVPTRACLDVVY